MDIISYGVAGKAGKDEKHTQADILGQGVEGTSLHVKERIDAIENSVQQVVTQADKLIVNDTVNIMKAHSKLNSVAKTMKYKMQNMIFDDLLDLSGIDTAKSSGHTFDATNGLLKASGSNPYTVVTAQELADTIPQKAVLVVEENAPSYGSNIIPVMTSNTSPSGIVTSSSIYSAGYDSWHAFDTTSSEWGAASVQTGWLAYDFQSPKLIGKYAIVSSTNILYHPKNWTFEGWDGSTWKVLDTQAGISWTSNQRREFIISNPQQYSKYRINVTANNGGGMLFINTLEMMELLNSSGLQGAYSISCDDGSTWQPITPESLFYFTKPTDKKIRLKAVLPASTQLLNYALTWV